MVQKQKAWTSQASFETKERFPAEMILLELLLGKIFQQIRYGRAFLMSSIKLTCVGTEFEFLDNLR